MAHRSAPRGSAFTKIFRIERYLARRATDRQVADETQAVLALFHTLALKGEGWKVLHIQKVCRAQMGIALLFTRVHACRVDGHLYQSACQVVTIDAQRAGEVGE